jgi:hypothetical protein
VRKLLSVIIDHKKLRSYSSLVLIVAYTSSNAVHLITSVTERHRIISLKIYLCFILHCNVSTKHYLLDSDRNTCRSKLKKTKLRGLLSASELYRPSDRRLLAKLVPTFADRGCRVVSATDPTGRFLDRSRYFFIQLAPQLS